MVFSVPDDSHERLMKLISNADADAIDALYAQCAIDFTLECGLKEIPEGANVVIEQMVQFRYSQLDAEGLASQSFSGQSESYLNDYPAHLRRLMQRFRRIGLR